MRIAVFFAGVAAVFAAAMLTYLMPSGDESPHYELKWLGGFGAVLVLVALVMEFAA